MIKITFGSDNGTVAPLYKKYPAELYPQPAYLEFDPKGDELALEADYYGGIGGGVPSKVWNNVIIRFDVSPFVLRSEIEALAYNERLESLLQRIREGFSIFGGCGCYTDDASQAMVKVEDLLRDLDLSEVWDADDWVIPAVCINAAAEWKSIEAYAETFEDPGEPNRVIHGDIAAAVARALSYEVERRSDGTAKKVAEMLAAYAGDEYSHLLEDFEEE